MRGEAATDLVGRDRLLVALGGFVDRVVSGRRVTAFVAGEAGIGKTALLRAAAAHAEAAGARTAWGTCLSVDGAPGYWPWTQAIEGLLRTVGAASTSDLAAEDESLLRAILPSIGDAATGDAATGESSERDRMLAMDAVRRLLETQARDRPVLVILDDLQWADPSSLALLELVARSPVPIGLGVIGAYRDHELTAATRERLSALGTGAEHLHVDGLDVDAVRALAEATTGAPVAGDVAAAVHRRTGGHPFFVRQLALLGNLTEPASDRVPVAIRDVIARRIDGLPAGVGRMLETAALVGTTLLPDVVAAALGASSVEVEAASRAAIDAGILTALAGEVRFAHDLLRETLEDRVEASRRIELHLAIGSALEGRRERGGEVAPADIARHLVAALPLGDPTRAVQWARAAAAADRASLAFEEAAAHLRRLRGALTATATDVEDGVLIDVLIDEADALARAGAALDARGLLRHAADVSERAGAPPAIARVALATARLGARFATRRDDIIGLLDRGRAAITGIDDALEARITATLARELQHSVAEDRPRAATLSERAIDLGRRAGDPGTLIDCLLARHDVLWQPGRGGARAEVAREIIEVAAAHHDDRHAEGQLLLANALLEQGSPAFEAPLESFLAILDRRGQPRDRYLVLARRACVALLRGDLDGAERLIDDAKALGDRILEPDAGNVYMSQRLELVRARDDRAELVHFAAAAVTHWTGAPVHAHAVAAGFSARAGDLAQAERHVAAVVDLGTWRVDRSYLWSVFVRELAHAAVALDQLELCRELLEDLLPLADSCGVNGAVIAFAGSHAEPAGLLASALGDQETAGRLADQAAVIYRRLGAQGGRVGPSRDVSDQASMRRDGQMWRISFGGRQATVAHTKGLADLARMLAAPGAEIHVLELFDAPGPAGASGELADRKAIASYRQRVTDLDAEIAEAESDNDLERRARSELERDSLLEELGRVVGAGGRSRQFANHPAERARKAVSARVRDAIRKLEPAIPALAAHLDATIVTGTYCRYRPDGFEWRVEP